MALLLGEAFPLGVILAGMIYALRFDRKTDLPWWDWRRLR